MAHLLGSKFCIDSLSKDVTDLQVIVNDVISRVGPVQVSSWKYPDKVSMDIDIEDVLDTFEDSEDDEDRQVAHITLLELVIDRLLFLLQSMSKYADQMSLMGRLPSGVQQSNNTSVGLVVKKYWSKMVHLYSILQQLQTEKKIKSRKIGELEDQITSVTEELEKTRMENTTTTPSNVLLIPPNNADLMALSRASGSTAEISSDVYQKSTQTYETAFVPCEGCAQVQQNLREVADVLIEICRSQGLPSSMLKHRSKVSELDWLTANDISRWIAEQNKDLSRISKHLEMLMSTINPLKSELSTSEQKCKDLQGKVTKYDKEVKLERETQSAQIRMYENKIKEIEKEKAEAIASVNHHNTELLSLQKDMEKQLEMMKSELVLHKKNLTELEKMKAHLSKELEMSNAANVEMQKLEQTKMELQAKLGSVTEELQKSAKDLSKEQAKLKSVTKHSSSLQNKQESLLSRINTMDEENEEVRQHVAELEEVKDGLEEALQAADVEKEKLRKKLLQEEVLVKKISEEKKTLEEKIVHLEGDIRTLETQLHEAQEREQLLIEYPDLNGPVNPDYQGSGDIAADMAKQIDANSTRIQVLENQNATLRQTITRMLTTRSQASVKNSAPVPLWKTESGDRTESQEPRHYKNNETFEDYQSHAQSTAVYKFSSQPVQVPYSRNPNLPPQPAKEKNTNVEKHEEVFIVSRANQQAENRGKRSRPPSGKETGKLTSAKGNSISTYMQLKKSGLIKGTDQRAQSRISSAKQEDSPSIMHMCSRCDKMYPTAKDLEIHHSYCYGV